MDQKSVRAISENPTYQHLVKTRSRYAWTLTAILMVVFYGYIYLVAFHREIMAQRIGEGVMTLSIPLGLGVIVFTVLITGVYVRKANADFDKWTREVKESIK